MKLENYELPARALAAALTHAAKRDLRHYLNGLLLDFRNGRIVSSDGNRMFIGQIPIADCESVIVERDQVERIVRAAKEELSNGWSVMVSISDEDVPLVTFYSAASGTSAASRAVDATYPDIERIIPQNPSGEVGQFNMSYLADTRKALAIYSGKNPSWCYPYVAHNGTGPCIVTDGYTTAFCVVMPTSRPEDVGVDARNWFYNNPGNIKGSV